MRFSKQAKKIMLTLLRHPESKFYVSSKGETTLGFLVWEIEGREAFYGPGLYGQYLLDGYTQNSYNRTLLTLSIEGYLDRWRRLDNRYYYYLTDKGEEKAREIKAEVLNFIEEWGSLVANGPPINAAPDHAEEEDKN